ncbi:beta-phosphoglucomutase [Aeromonas enteropelogenes]|uniref:beta-phosphoglucomutase n=1 Tax=Aeromonas enteropelogenes TaxID=29489 RepID=UPI003B9F523E
MCKAFIFDLDGVITDTAELHFQAWLRMANEEGYYFDRKINEQLRGVSRQTSLSIILAGTKLSEIQTTVLMARKNKYYLEQLESLSEKDILPGIRSLLLELNARGIKVAVASASKNARYVLYQLGLIPLFDAICDGWSVVRSKPEPDIFIYAAGQLRVNTCDCIVMEDAEAGIHAARAAGMQVVGIGPSARVGQADWHFNDTATFDLTTVLENAEPNMMPG